MTLRIAAPLAALALLVTCRAGAPAQPAPTPAPVRRGPAIVAPLPAPQATAMPLTLAQAEDIALASSPLLAVARGQLLQAQAIVGEARSAGLPSVDVTGASVRSKSTSAGFGGSGGGGASPAPSSGATLATSTSASLGLRQLIIDGGRVRASVEAAKFSTDSARLQLQRQIQNVEFSVAQAYYAALQARHQLIVARDSLNLAQVQERLVAAQYHAGVASRADVLTAQLPVAQAQLAVAQAQNGEQTQIATLLNAMGLPSQTAVTVSEEPAGTQSLPAVSDIFNAALRARPDLLAAQAALDAANENVRAARLGLFPNISGTANAGTSATKLDAVPGTGNFAPSSSVGVAVSFPLFDGGLTRAQTAAAQAQADQAAANLKATQLLVSLNVQQAYLGLQTALAGLDAANAEYAQARTVLDVTNAQYKSGVTTLPLLLNAQVGLARAEGDQVTALYTYKTAWQQLLLAEGTIGR